MNGSTVRAATGSTNYVIFLEKVALFLHGVMDSCKGDGNEEAEKR